MSELSNNFVTINSCRLCSGRNIREFVTFPSVPIGNNLQMTKESSKKVENYELKVMRCSDCNHFQLSISVSPALLYATNYSYLSGIGLSFVMHLKKYVGWVIKKSNLNSQNVVVDIGSNDGSCLKYFKESGYKVCGVDPAQKPAEIANQNGIFTINDFFNSNVANQIIKKFGKVGIVTSQNALAHVDDLLGTFRNIYKILKIGGFFVFEIGYFKKVLNTKCFDTIYHEHIDYHHANPLVKVLVSLGFDILDISENNVQGGSLRLLLKKTNLGIIKEQPLKFLYKEKYSILYNELKLQKWPSNIEKRMEHFYKLYLECKSKDKVCYAYGAPTKACLLYKTSKLKEKDISFIVEDNNLKVGKFLPDTSIPILSLESVDFEKQSIIIIFAWNFASDIIKKLQQKYKVPATIIIPLPNPRIVQI